MAAENDVILTGFIKGDPLYTLLSFAHTFVLPSTHEGHPIALLEAMSYGNCCLVSDIEECAAVVEDHAVVFKKSNIEDLREKLQILCSDEKTVSSYKEKAADYICKKYDWDTVTEKTLELYQR